MPKKILIIEDDEFIRESMIILLESEGYLVDSAENGKRALEILQTSPTTKPDLIFLDLMMPVMDGFEFRTNQLKDTSIANIPIIVMSADGNVQDKKKRIGAIEYLKKPVNIDRVIEVTKETLETN